MTPETPGELEIVGEYRFPHEAWLAKSELEAFGVDAWVLGERRRTYEDASLGAVQLAVRGGDARSAREILAGDHSGDLAHIPESQLPPAPGDLCPHCGADALEQVSGQTSAGVLRRMLRSALALLVGSYAPAERRGGVWRCRACGK